MDALSSSPSAYLLFHILSALYILLGLLFILPNSAFSLPITIVHLCFSTTHAKCIEIIHALSTNTCIMLREELKKEKVENYLYQEKLKWHCIKNYYNITIFSEPRSNTKSNENLPTITWWLQLFHMIFSLAPLHLLAVIAKTKWRKINDLIKFQLFFIHSLNICKKDPNTWYNWTTGPNMILHKCINDFIFIPSCMDVDDRLSVCLYMWVQLFPSYSYSHTSAHTNCHPSRSGRA